MKCITNEIHKSEKSELCEKVNYVEFLLDCMAWLWYSKNIRFLWKSTGEQLYSYANTYDKKAVKRWNNYM